MLEIILLLQYYRYRERINVIPHKRIFPENSLCTKIFERMFPKVSSTLFLQYILFMNRKNITHSGKIRTRPPIFLLLGCVNRIDLTTSSSFPWMCLCEFEIVSDLLNVCHEISLVISLARSHTSVVIVHSKVPTKFLYFIGNWGTI